MGLVSIQTTSIEKRAYVSEEFADMRGERIKEIVGEDYYSKEEVEGIREGVRKEKENLRKELLKEVKNQQKTIDSQKREVEELSKKLETYRREVNEFITAEQKFAEKLLKKVEEAEELEDVENWIRKATEKSK